MTTEPSPLDHVRRSIDLLWGTDDRATRGPRPSLSLVEIVVAAIAVADADGIDALSMRRVASELGAGTMSLYRYVPGKAELLALMLDKVCDPSDGIAQAKGKDWRGQLETIARGAYRLYLTHRWLLQVNWTRPVLGPNSLAGVEHFIGCLNGLGLTSQERVATMVTIDGFVTGVARQRIQHAALPDETGVSDEEFWAHQYPILARAMETGNYPAMAGLDEDACGLGWDESFEFGLQRLLDGLTTLVESRRHRTGGQAA